MTTWSLTGREATCGGGGGRRAPGACVQPVHKVSQVFQGGFFLEVYLNSVDAVLQQHTVRIVVSDATVVVDAAEPCRVQKIGERYQPRDAELSTLAEDVGICDFRRWQPSCKACLLGCPKNNYFLPWCMLAKGESPLQQRQPQSTMAR